MSRGILSWGDFVLGGILSRGILSGGFCPGGFCPGGFCPDTDYCIDHKYNNMLTFKIESETDLHVKVVHFLKKRYPHSLFTVTLGENQDTVYKRIDSFKKGYLRGSPDLIINNLHKHYTGFCIEMKSPKGNGVLSSDQSMMLRQYRNNGFKTLVSNDYDHIIGQIIEYFRDVRILCSYCPRRFISSQSLKNHIKSFHKM